MKLVIVESPTKAKTISKFLGSGYSVYASMGHVRDLPKSKIGIDVLHNFTPTYTIPAKAKETIAMLAKESQSASEIILATDEDREGEAISWHLVQALGLDGTKQKAKGKVRQAGSGESEAAAATSPKPYSRIVFHEITKSAIEEALEHPRKIDMNLVNAQQARRVLDRLVGYELSPFLWRKIRYGLSAGRVQSVAVRLIVEREREINAFKQEEYWSIEALFKKGRAVFPGRLTSVDGKTLDKMEIRTREDAERITRELDGRSYAASNVTTKEIRRNPPPPFTTSTLQQEAARKFGFSAKQTMVIAQRLYENGHITYMRTDSLNLAASALAQARHIIGEQFGSEYQLDAVRTFSNTSKGAQEAHEAIRPTDLGQRPSDGFLTDRGQHRLYDLIWKRTIACQMQPATIEQTSIDITADSPKNHTFRSTGQVILFDGFFKVYTEGRDEDGGENGDVTEGTLPKLAIGDAVAVKHIEPAQHFTTPPPRFTDATLIKTLEAAGIGRPSTYAPTLATIQEREYVEKIEKKYRPTEIGFLVNDMLVEHFPEIVDVNFTSHIEEEFDKIAEGELPWIEVTREFYEPFKKHLNEKEKEVEKQIEFSETPCPHCGKPMLIKFGRMGKFLACPEEGSKVTLPMPEEAAKIKELEEKTRDERCPICGKPMQVKRGRFGFFLGCSDYPQCKGISKIWDKTGFKCLNCHLGDIVLKKSRGRGQSFYACTRYPDCTFVMSKKPESEQELQAALEHWRANPPKARLANREDGGPPKPRRTAKGPFDKLRASK